ncbi:UDP-N-acetylglucosamine 1-carboxyvinyltransferase [Frankliniella fusca]|uniref:UDP-N-acetylglucosamine 1-carboxyvinyltransferase n=1 Tax=Frankliniella fusca TaxID=407009 RepID=A0AAE1LM27_9NEOP|nr:UDP-N-acetylglucosamine 1-carboxyvinyltransferase [Frankliniella fusca]
MTALWLHPNIDTCKYFYGADMLSEMSAQSKNQTCRKIAHGIGLLSGGGRAAADLRGAPAQRAVGGGEGRGGEVKGPGPQRRNTTHHSQTQLARHPQR